jgi:hypothetical protein
MDMPEPAALSVSYRMTTGELLRASRRLSLHPYYTIFRQIVAYLALIVAISLSSCLISRIVFHNCEGHAWIPFSIFLLMVYFDVWMMRRDLARREAQSPVFGLHHMTISSEELVDETPGARYSLKWTAIERIESDDAFIYVIIYYPLLYVISKRSFETATQAETFYMNLLEYHRKARIQQK